MSTTDSRWPSLLLLALLCCLSGCQHRRDTQANNTGLPGNCTLCGVFVAEDGQPLQGAKLQLSGPSLSGTRVAETDQFGFYWFPLVPAGHGYTILLTDQRTIPIQKDHIILLAGTTLTLPFTADTRGGMSLSAADPMIDYKATSTTTILQYNPETGQSEVNFR